MKMIVVILMVIVFSLTGCALFHSIKPGETIINNPLGTDSIKIGMTREEVKSKIGDPDAIVYKDVTKGVLNAQIEEWTYRSHYSDVPLKADYFGKTLILTFDGDNLTGYKNIE